MLVQIDGKPLKEVRIPSGVSDEKLWLFTTLYKDIDVRARIGSNLKRVVHVPGKLINMLTK
jgi:hypothetical protein